MRLFAAGFFVVLALAVFSPHGAFAATAEERAALQAQLDQIERDIANNQGSLTELQRARTTLERDIAILDNKIKNAQLQIKQSDLTLKQIGTSIADKQAAIGQVDSRVLRSQRSLAQILRHTREIDDIPLAQTALVGSLSDVFTELDNFQTLQRELEASFTEMAALRSDLSARQKDLQDKHEEAQQVRTAQVISKNAVLQDEKEKQGILSATKGQEKAYQQMIADKKKQANAIREALFGLRDTGAISFGNAYAYAKEASVGTGVSPALTLAILTQESDLGVNMGSCLVTSLDTGAGVGKNTGKYFSNVMKSPRDTVPFQTITEAIGKDWMTTPVSCSQGSGYGGAMGPSQFIPSTWMLYKDRLSQLTGESFPNPWNARTAIFATALLMADNGADDGTRAAERKAALKYFAGGYWNKPANAPYGNSVMELRDKIQADIDIIGG